MTQLPRRPSRDNAATGCTFVDETDQDPDLPEYIRKCTCSTHTGACRECNFKITVSTSGVEYGHRRKNNLGPNAVDRRDCSHRSSEVDPAGGRGGASA